MTVADSLAPRPLGQTGLVVTPICVGGGPLGSMSSVYGYRVPAERATATVLRALQSSFNFLDTSANYGDGESERRIGEALREIGGVPEGFVLATKVDRDSTTGDFSAAQVRRSLEGSLQRLGVDHIPLLYLHDPEYIGFEEAMASGGPVGELLRLREEGLAEHLGIAGGPVPLMRRFIETRLFDVLLTHNRWTLVDRSAAELLDEAMALGIGVVNGAPFGGGILAKGPDGHKTYAYGAIPPEVLARIQEMAGVCNATGVPLAAAALQFSLRDPRIVSTIVGVSRPERLEEAQRLATLPIPDSLWKALESLAAPPEYWLR